MTIGLSVKQIRKLAKSGYSDKQLAAQGEVRSSGDAWWHNGIVVLFEPVPESVSVEKCLPSRTLAYAKMIGEMIAKCRYRVYPVEVAPHAGGTMRKLVFESNCADRVAVDARYVVSLLTTKRVGKKPDIRWYTDFRGETLYAENGRRLGIVLGLHELPGNEPEWNFRYIGELPC